MSKLKPGDLKVTDASEAFNIAHHYDAGFSICDPGDSRLIRAKHWTSYYTFSDVHEAHYAFVYPTPALMSAMRYQIQEFLRNDNLKNVLVHCYAGVSRSTACAIFILLEDGWSSKDAVEHVFDIREIASPNGLMIKMIDEYHPGTANAVSGMKALRAAKWGDVWGIG